MQQRITSKVVRESFAELVDFLNDRGLPTEGIALDDRGPNYPYRYCLVDYGTSSGQRSLRYFTESWPGTYRKGPAMLEMFRGIIVGVSWSERYSENRANDRNVDR